MYITNITDYDNITTSDITLSKCTNNENIIEIIIPLSTVIPCGMSLICLISLMIYTLFKPFLNRKQMENFLYPQNPVRCIITGPSECG